MGWLKEVVVAAAGVSADDEATGKEKENGEPPAAARHEVIKPVPGRSRFGSQSEANPLAALHPECVPLSSPLPSLLSENVLHAYHPAAKSDLNWRVSGVKEMFEMMNGEVRVRAIKCFQIEGAVICRVLAAAVKARGSDVSGLSAPNRGSVLICP